MNPEHDDWLAELIAQQAHRDDWLSEADLRDAWDRYFDVRAEEQRDNTTVGPSEAEVNALHLLAGLLDDDDDQSVAAMKEVLTDLGGDETVQLLLVVLRILIRQIELDYGHTHHAVDRDGHPEVDDGLTIGESDFTGLAELDSDDVLDVLLKVCTMLLGVVGDRREVLRSIIRTQLQEVGRR